jgi:hypothetical protein
MTMGERPAADACLCFCIVAHPDRPTGCLGTGDVTVTMTVLAGQLQVPMCRPCADAATGVPAGTIIAGEVLQDPPQAIAAAPEPPAERPPE